MVLLLLLWLLWIPVPVVNLSEVVSKLRWLEARWWKSITGTLIQNKNSRWQNVTRHTKKYWEIFSKPQIVNRWAQSELFRKTFGHKSWQFSVQSGSGEADYIFCRSKLVLDIGRLEIIEKKLLLFCVGNELVAGGSGGCQPEKTTAFHGNLRNGWNLPRLRFCKHKRKFTKSKSISLYVVWSSLAQYQPCCSDSDLSQQGKQITAKRLQ